jgi:hypothetical protein
MGMSRSTGLRGWRRGGAAVVVAVVTGCGLALSLSACGPSRSGAESALSVAKTQAVQEPTSVEAFRVDTSTRVAEAGERRIGTYRALAGPFAVGASEVAMLKDLVSGDSRGAGGGAMTNCKFQPLVAYRFVGRGEVVDVLVCFTCNELATFLNERPMGLGTLGDRRAAWVRLTQRVFPNDGIVTALQP